MRHGSFCLTSKLGVHCMEKSINLERMSHKMKTLKNFFLSFCDRNKKNSLFNQLLQAAFQKGSYNHRLTTGESTVVLKKYFELISKSR